MKKLLLLVAAVSGLVAGCGSDGGSTSIFEDGTVTYNVSPINSSVTSTVGTAPTTADTNIVTITTSSTVNPDSTRKSPYTVKDIVIRYTKRDNSSFVLTEYVNFSVPMTSGGTAVIPITVATSTIKDALLNRGFSSDTPWNFWVNASFTILEDLSGVSKSYNAQLGTAQFK